MMPRMKLCLLLMLGAAASLPAAPAALPSPRVDVAPMKTSIYVGTVRLTTTTFVRAGDDFTATYEARVFPWFFWSETGRITIHLPLPALARLAAGETVEFTGQAVNQKDKPRAVTGRAQRTDATSGRIKVRIMADGVELVFNSTYAFLEAKLPDRP